MFLVPETHFFEQQDGSRIAYKVFESQYTKNVTPLVFIVGLLSIKEHFMGLEEELAKHRKVIIFDNRGIGESSVVSSDDPISVDLMAQDTIALIKHLEIKQFNLLGWSMGGNIALCVATNMPSDLKLEKLIICSSFARAPPIPFFEFLYNLPKLDPPKSIQEQKDEIIKSFEKVFADYLLKNPDKFDKLAEISFNARRPFEIFKRQYEAIEQSNLTSSLKTIKVPTLIVHGEVDEIIPIKNSELLDREIPNTKFVRIPDVGHMFFVMESESGAMNEFLNE